VQAKLKSLSASAIIFRKSANGQTRGICFWFKFTYMLLNQAVILGFMNAAKKPSYLYPSSQFHFQKNIMVELNRVCRYIKRLHQLWWEGVATLPWGTTHRHPSLFQSAPQFCTWTLCVMHWALPARPQPLVRSLQLVEVWPWPYSE